VSDQISPSVDELLGGLEAGLELAAESLETCDGCGPHIRAIWLVETARGPLTFCGEHYRRYRWKMRGERPE
jgi:hypothetical protein